jgi:L-fuculose-phosphate aldolase
VKTLAQQLLETSQKLVQLGLNKGTSGNASVRCDGGFLVTPSGLPVEEMTAKSMVHMSFEPNIGTQKDLSNVNNTHKPSSEWHFHQAVLQKRPEINAVIHTHSMFATTLACMHKEIPPFHYMIAVVGGDTIRCAPYALFGTEALSDVALEALTERKACLLANHGMIALGRDLDDALAVTVEVENLCEQYWRLLQITPNPPLLSATQMREVFQQFKGYGKWDLNNN